MKYNDCTDGFLSLCPEMFGCPYRNFPELFRPLLPLSCLPFLSLYAAMGACCPLRRPAPALLRSLRLPFFCVKISVFSTFCPPVRCVSCLCFSSCGVKKVSKRFGDTEKSSTFAIPFEKWASLSGRWFCEKSASAMLQRVFFGNFPGLRASGKFFLKKVLENQKKAYLCSPVSRESGTASSLKRLRSTSTSKYREYNKNRER